MRFNTEIIRFNYIMEGLRKVLVINGCSQSKLSHPAPAREFYTGQLFRMVRKFSELHGFEQRIVSGKYGLLTLNDLVDPYDLKISTKADIKRVQDKCLYRLVELHKAYDSIIVILGKKYREVISPILDSKCLVVFDRKGIFGYYSLIAYLNQITRPQVLEDLSKFRVAGCLHCKGDSDLPRTCHFCYFQSKNKCSWNYELQQVQEINPTKLRITSEGEN